MKKILSVLLCALLMCSLFSSLAASADTVIDEEKISGDAGTKITANLCQGDVVAGVGTIYAYSGKNTSGKYYYQGSANCSVKSTYVGSYEYTDHYARVAYGATKADITISSTTQKVKPLTTYSTPASVSYSQSNVSLPTGVIYCFTRVSYAHSTNSSLQRHAARGRYYCFSH